ncbi:hypothetical protein BJV78DRAFT_1150812 [Lactifluus subvellereus]|nr:hypothetical protein BJV78DRAFT_1150812 [Lactifluus subvellereus]
MEAFEINHVDTIPLGLTYRRTFHIVEPVDSDLPGDHHKGHFRDNPAELVGPTPWLGGPITKGRRRLLDVACLGLSSEVEAEGTSVPGGHLPGSQSGARFVFCSFPLEVCGAFARLLCLLFPAISSAVPAAVSSHLPSAGLYPTTTSFKSEWGTRQLFRLQVLRPPWLWRPEG